jgi:DNA-binding response OmpR family regulator
MGVSMNEMLDAGVSRVSSQEPKSILLVDDDIKYCRLIAKYLANHDYQVTPVHNGASAVETFIGRSWDAVILDIMLPGVNGFEILRGIRERSDVPILMLTAVSDETDRIVGLEMGADDYLPKNYSAREMLARLRAVLRRSHLSRQRREDAAKIIVGPLVIDPSMRKVTLEGKLVRLTGIEFDLLLSLALVKGRIKTREQLLNDVRSVDYESCDRSIDVHISLLRKKLNDDAKNPRMIKTIRAVGYSLENPDEIDSCK